MIPSSVSSNRTARNMGTNRRLLISIGGLLLVLTCIHAQGQKKKISEEDWDSFDQEYGQMNVDDIDAAEEQQLVGDDDEDVQQQSDGRPSRVNIIASPAPVYRSQNPSHNQRICTTFGNHHFKTFDGDIFHFPGNCSYQFVRHCKTNYEEFFVGITRHVRKNVPVISGINMKLDGVDITVAEKTVIVNSVEVEELPFSIGGTQISKTGTYLRISSKIGFEMYWNEEDSITLELSQKYVNQTCGLCGDYNGIPIHNEFIMNNVPLTNVQYGNLHKYTNPEEERCQDTNEEEEETTCPHNKQICTTVLTGTAFHECNKMLEVQKYIELCEKDICRCTGNSTGFCLCNIFTEYSRQCTHAGGKPKNWRTSKICPLKCAFNLQFKECGTACADTCTNPDRSSVCDDHCTDGCFCPAGLVFDDIRKTGCIAKEECPCTHNGDVYPSGKGYAEKCQECTCQGGKWNCVKKQCFGVCALEGGSHVTTFDATRYNFHGDCTYTLSKSSDSSLFSVLAELSKCGQTDTETCLRSITLSLNGGKEFIFVKKCGSVYVNSVYTKLPVSTASATIFMPTSFFIIIQAKMGIQIKVQMVPTMQVFVAADPQYMGKTSGLCGNFNDIQADDFHSPAGVLEGTGSSYGNLWKTQLDCPNVKNNFEDPCALIGQNEQYASHHCDVLLASDGPFASCHKTVDPEAYHKNCMFDACNCEKKEDCMCTALSSYVTACSRQGVDLRGWRTNICHSYTATCPLGQIYRYTVSTCTPSCRGLSEHDITCEYDIGTIDGCTCEDGTYLDDNGKCVLPVLCSCYYKGTAMSPGEVIHEKGSMCTCTNGKLDCVGIAPVVIKECEHPMVYHDCDKAPAGAKGSECQKSCSTFDSDCYSSGCVSGCVCPEGLVLDDERNICIPEEDCPCTLNDDFYAAGETVQVKCNTCTCKSRKWECTTNTCLGTCAVYGDGHYLTPDNRRYRFNGNCWYTLAQDYCSNDPNEGTFRVLTENVQGGTQGTTSSKSIRVMLGNYELSLGEQKFDVIKRNQGTYVPFKVRQMGLYMVIEAANGLALVWDKKNSISIKMDPKFEGKICGLCGNFDGNAANDFVTRSQAKVGDVHEFGNSWKLSERCPNAVEIKDTCASNPYRKAWSQKQCSIITSSVFASCHGVVDPVKYYEACVNDACACDAGGDCDCFCTAVAAYSQACSEAGQCISWRTPHICPVFCDFYNQQGHCEWHYKACGAPCMKTCMNPTGVCFNKLLGLEGCYPTCPEDRPFFDEETMQCVASCHCYDEYGDEFKPGEKMPGPTRCSDCMCTKNGRECTHAPGCCEYEGKEFLPGDIVYYTADGIGGCLNAICSDNSTIERRVGMCPTTTAPPTTFDFSPSSEEHTSTPPTSHGISPTSSIPTKPSPDTSSSGESTEQPTTSSSGTPTASTPSCVEAHECTWSQWYDVSKPENGEGDFERFEDIESKGYEVCKNPRNVECRAKEYPNQSLKDLKQEVTCSRKTGLVCLNSENPPLCKNLEMRIECCKYRECTNTPSSPSEEQPSSTTSSSVDIKTQPPTPKEHPTSLPVQVTSQTPASTTSATPQQPESTKTPLPPGTTTCVFKMECRWTSWYDTNSPSDRSDGGDIKNVDDIESAGHDVCTNQEVKNNIECEAVDDKGLTTVYNSQNFSCDVNGLICNKGDQKEGKQCKNHKMRIECCRKVCETIQTPGVTTTEITEPKTPGGETATQGTTPSTPISSGTPSKEDTPLPTTLCVNKKQCRWTKWFDNNKPSTKSKGGDTESIAEIESTGSEVCSSKEVKDRIECRAVETNGVPTENNNQIFRCNMTFGLDCKNSDQKNKTKCKNYQMRVLCCEEVCEPVSTPAISTPKTSEPTTHETPATKLPEPGSTSISSTKKPNSETPSQGTSPSSSAPSSSEVITSSTSTTCQQKLKCRWTRWFDINKPSSKSDGGDRESPDEIKALGHEICTGSETAHKIECEAIDTKGVTIADNKQIITCAMGSGLTCMNRAQENKTKCENYKMRMSCCALYCEPVKTPTKTTTVSSKSPTPTTSSITEPTRSSPKDCENERAVECRWTQWLNNNQPSTAINGEERENSHHSKSLGSEVCKPGEVENQIECKSGQYSETAIQQNRDKKTICNVKDGLICRNQDQSGENCPDYSIRYECCSENFVKSCGESTTSSTKGTSMPTTISATKSSSEKSSPSTSATGTSPGHKPLTSSEEPSSSTEVESTPPASITESSSTEVESTPPGSSDSSSPSYTKSPTSSIGVTSAPKTTSSTTKTESSSTPPATTTSCEKLRKSECRWSGWQNKNEPSPGPSGGERESADQLKSEGIEVCSHEEVQHKIQCQAAQTQQLSHKDSEQNIICDLIDGLVCNNSAQIEENEECKDYEIRYECCSKRFIEFCGKTTPSATSPSSSEVTKSPSTTSITEPLSPGDTTPGQTQTDTTSEGPGPSTPERPEETSRPPGTPPRGTTPGEPSTPEKTSQPPGTPPRDTTSGQPTNSEETERTTQSPGTPPRGTTPGQSSTPEKTEETSQPPGTPPRGTTPGESSTPEKTSQPPGTPPRDTTSGQPTNSEEPERTTQPPGTPPRGTTPGQSSTPEKTEETSQPPGTPPRGTTPGESSTPEKTSQPPGTPPRDTTSGQPTNSEEPERTTQPPGTPPRGTTPGQSSTPEKTEETSQPPGTPPRGTTPDETSTPEKTSQTPGTPPRDTTSGQPTNSEETERTTQPPGTPPRGTTPGQSSTPEKTESSSTPPATTTSCEKLRKSECRWSGWQNKNEPSPGPSGGERESAEQLKSEGIEVCSHEEVQHKIQCQAAQTQQLIHKDSEQNIICDLIDGLVCNNSAQIEENEECKDYEIRYECCSKRFIEFCGKTTPSPTSPSSSEVTKSLSTTSITEPLSPGDTTPGQTQTDTTSEGPGPSTPERPEETSQPPGTPPRGTTPGEPSTPEKTSQPPGTPPRDTTSGQPTNSEEPERTTQPPGTPPRGTTPGQSSTPEKTEETSQPPGTPPRGTTPGESSTPEKTSQPPGTPPRDTTSGQPTNSEEPERTTQPPGTPPRGTTPGQSSTPEKTEETSQPPGTPPRGTTPGKSSTPEKTSQPPGTPPRDTTSGQPTNSEEPERTTQPPGTPPRGTTPGQSSTPEKTEETSQPPGTPPRGTTPDETSTPEKTSQTPGTPPRDTTSGQPTNSEETERTTQPPGTPPRGTTPGEPSTPEKTESSSTPPATTTSCEKLRKSECRWSGWQNKNEPSPGPSGGERESAEQLKSEGIEVCSHEEVQHKIQCQAAQTQQLIHKDSEQNIICDLIDGLVCNNSAQIEENEECKDYEIRYECCSKRFIEFCGKTTPSPTSPSSSEVTKSLSTTSITEPLSPGDSTPGQTQTDTTSEGPGPSTPERPEETSQPPGTPPRGTTPGEPSTPEKTSQPPGTPPRDTTSGQPTNSEEPEKTTQPPGTPPRGTTPGQSSTPEKTEETSQPPGTPPRGTTPGEPSTPEKTSQPPGTPPRDTTSGQPTNSVEPERTTQPPGTPPRGTTPGQSSTPEKTEETSQPPGTPPRGTTPGEPSTPEKTSQPPGTPPKGTTSGQPTNSEEPERTTQPPGTPPRGTTPGQSSTPEKTEETSPPPGTPPRGTTPGEQSNPETSQPPGTSPGDTSGDISPPKTLETSTSISSTTSSPVTITSTSGTTAHPTGSSPLTTSSAMPSGSTVVLTTTVTPEQSTPSSEAPASQPVPITKCFCKVNDELFSPGETIYSRRDRQGCAFHAVCGATCEIERSTGECSPTEKPSTSLENIKDITSGKPKITRPSRRPPTGPHSHGTSNEPGTSDEPSTSTESGDSASDYVDTMPHDNQPRQDVLRSYSLEGLGGTNENQECGPCECLMPNCSTGYRVVSLMPPGACCATITCEPDSVCVADNTIYKPGSIIPLSKNICQKCECSNDEKDESGFYAVKCQELLCDRTCEKGFEYAEKEGECCGECVPKQCTMKKKRVESGENAESGQKVESGENAESGQKVETGENAESGQKVESGENAWSGQKGESGENEEKDTHILIQIGDTYRPEGSTCSYYECDEEDGKPVLTKVKKVCQELDESFCEEGSVKYDEDGCCKTCTPKTETKVEQPVVENCSVRKNVTLMKEGDCEVEVERTHCGGPCMGTSMYSAESQGMEHKCSCCRALEVASRQVEMLCTNGQRLTHHYEDAVRCGCSVATCEPVGSAEIQESQQQQQSYQTSYRRRRR